MTTTVAPLPIAGQMKNLKLKKRMSMRIKDYRRTRRTQMSRWMLTLLKMFSRTPQTEFLKITSKKMIMDFMICRCLLLSMFALLRSS